MLDYLHLLTLCSWLPLAIRVDLLLVIPLTTMTFTAIGVWGLPKSGDRRSTRARRWSASRPPRSG